MQDDLQQMKVLLTCLIHETFSYLLFSLVGQLVNPYLGESLSLQMQCLMFRFSKQPIVKSLLCKGFRISKLLFSEFQYLKN